MRFLDREDAGRQLAGLLLDYKDASPLVLALPRGGVPVAYPIAVALDAQLDVFVVRKVGAPFQPELGLGAVAERGIVYLNPDTIRRVGATDEEIEAIVRARGAEVAERARRFRGDRSLPPLEGRTIILVDDGIATGGTVHAAIQALRTARPRSIVLAVPVAAAESLDHLRPLVDSVICIHPSRALYAVGQYYDDFDQVPDEEVVRLLELARARSQQSARPPSGMLEVTIPVRDAELNGTLTLPANARGVVLFAHGSGSSRFSPRNRYVAETLQSYGLATLLFDLLTRDEERLDERTGELRFDIPLLARRLVDVTDWAREFTADRGLGIGYFGSSTGAAAALIAAADRPKVARAVVSRGGRPDLAWDALERVAAPTLLIVGGDDTTVLRLNQRAWSRLLAPRKLAVIPGATHLFEEPGALDEVARMAAEWFVEHLVAEQPVATPPSGAV